VRLRVPIPRRAPIALVRQWRAPGADQPDDQPRRPAQTTNPDDQASISSSRPAVSTKETAVYAIVRAGAIQQKVAVGDVIEIDKVATAVGETLTLPVVMVVDGEKVTATGLDKAGVTVEVLGATKGPKIVIQKYKNKTGYKKRQGHRQKYTQVKVTDISL
jgi:large subunit ribosomal protein L21